MRYFTEALGQERVFRFRLAGHIIAEVLDDAGQVRQTFVVDAARTGDGAVLSLVIDGRAHDCVVEQRDGRTVVAVDGERVDVSLLDERQKVAAEAAAARGGGTQTVEAIMPGVVVELRVAEGDVVEAGQTLLVLEAMKMQNPIQASAAGRVARVAVVQGAAVAGGALLLEIEPVEE